MDEIKKLKGIEINADGAQGFTTAEASELWGVNHDAGLVRLKKLIKSGVVEFAGKSPRTAIDGRIQRVSVYRVKK